MSDSRPKIIEIFDRQRVRQNRNRAAASFKNHDFLFHWVTDQLHDRVQDIKRTFPQTLQIGGRGFHQNPTLQDVIVMDIAEKFLMTGTSALQGDEEALPFAPQTFDMVISPLSLHTTNDMPGTLIQINKVLKPDGVFLGALLGGETLYELRDIMMQAEIKARGGVEPHIAPFADKQQLGSLMQRAGFALPVVDSEIITVSYPHTCRLMQDLRGMGEGHSLKDRSRPLHKALLSTIDTLYHEQYPDKEGRIRASFEIIFLIGWSPHQSQQKPLRPGSAKSRLADILESKEIIIP